MPPNEICAEHTKLVSDIEVIKNDIKYIREKVCDHIHEGEKEGGFRDRLIVLEQTVSSLKKAMWARVSVAGLIGGLIGSGSADALGVFLKWIMNH
jgi:hypothetical protein